MTTENTRAGWHEDDIPGWVVGENPTHDDDTRAQYQRGLASVGLRNELITKYSGENVFKFISEAMVEEIRQAGRGARVLTVGTGTGEIEYEAAKRMWFRNPQILGSDLYPHYHVYQQRAKDERLHCLEYMTLDARELPFDANSIDFLLAPFVVYHIDGEKGGPEKAIQELHRVAKPGAKTLIGTRGPGHMRQLWEEWLPTITETLSEDSLIDYKPPKSWYPNCDIERTGLLLDRTFGNKRITFRQSSPKHHINIPATKEGWQDIRLAIVVAFKDNIRPVPPESGKMLEIIDSKIKDDFFEKAAANGGFFPLEIEQAVLEAIKV